MRSEKHFLSLLRMSPGLQQSDRAQAQAKLWLGERGTGGSRARAWPLHPVPGGDHDRSLEGHLVPASGLPLSVPSGGGTGITTHPFSQVISAQHLLSVGRLAAPGRLTPGGPVSP